MPAHANTASEQLVMANDLLVVVKGQQDDI